MFVKKKNIRLYSAVSSAKRMLAFTLALPSHTVNRSEGGGGVVMEDKVEMKKEGARWRRIKELGENRVHLQP